MPQNKHFDERYLAFGAAILKLIPQLPPNKVGAHICDQLFRSGTSVGAHLQEARAAESRADFVHKQSMALKEMREAKYWLSLIRLAGIVTDDLTGTIFKEAGELVAILSQSVITTKAKIKTPQTSNVGPQM